MRLPLKIGLHDGPFYSQICAGRPFIFKEKDEERDLPNRWKNLWPGGPTEVRIVR